MAHAPSDDVAAVAVVDDAISTGDDADTQARIDEEALVKVWQGKVRRARKADKHVRDELDKWRRYNRGEPQKGKAEWLVDTNLIEATIEGLLPSIYAKDPEIEIAPSEAVDPSDYPVVRQFAKTLAVVVRRLLWDAQLKKRMQRAVRSVFPTGVGTLKVTMQLDSERDPEIEREINSLTENLRHIDFLVRDMGDPTGSPELHDAKRAELQGAIEALQAKVEVMVARGLVIDLVVTDDLQVDDELRELADYTNANWIAQRVWYTPERAMEKFGFTREQLAGATIYRNQTDDAGPEGGDARFDTTDGAQNIGWLACWEIWNKPSTIIYTMIEGLKQWARAPFPPTPCGRRFYPFFILAFHWQENTRWPLIPIKNWHKLQDEYARTRSSFALHRKNAKPSRVADKDAFSPEDAKKVSNPDTNELVLVDRIDKTRPISECVGVLDYPQVDMGLYDTGAIRADLEQVSGLSDAGRSAVTKAKTATEASIVAGGDAGRSSLKQDDVEDICEEIAVYVAELALQSMTLQDAQKYAGQGAVWPRLELEQIHTLLDINVRAGSSGKPNQVQEQQTWATLGPQFVQLLTLIFQARQANNFPLADSLTTMLKITLDKFDIKIDINELVPKQAAPMMQQGGAIPPDAGGVPGDMSAPNEPPLPEHIGQPQPLPASTAGFQ